MRYSDILYICTYVYLTLVYAYILLFDFLFPILDLRAQTLIWIFPFLLALLDLIHNQNHLLS